MEARSPTSRPDEVFCCSNCGELVTELDEFTGWCLDCSPDRGLANARIERWLEVNADAIEHHMLSGLSIWQAVDLLAKDRPKCLVCGQPIRRASRASVFCRQTTICRRFSRRYVYLYREKKFSKVEALTKILEELS